MTQIVLLGCGRMGGALLKGWIARKAGPIIVVEPKPSAALKTLAKKKAITLVAAVQDIRHSDLPEIAQALCLFRLRLGTRQRRQQHAREDCDNRYHHQ